MTSDEQYLKYTPPSKNRPLLVKKKKGSRPWLLCEEGKYSNLVPTKFILVSVIANVTDIIPRCNWPFALVTT